MAFFLGGLDDEQLLPHRLELRLDRLDVQLQLSILISLSINIGSDGSLSNRVGLDSKESFSHDPKTIHGNGPWLPLKPHLPTRSSTWRALSAASCSASSSSDSFMAFRVAFSCPPSFACSYST